MHLINGLGACITHWVSGGATGVHYHAKLNGPLCRRCRTVYLHTLQALQLQLMRRLVQQMVGPSYKAALPELLLEDAGQVAGSCSPGADVGLPGRRLRMLQELQAMAASSWPAQLSAGRSWSVKSPMKPLHEPPTLTAAIDADPPVDVLAYDSLEGSRQASGRRLETGANIEGLKPALGRCVAGRELWVVQCSRTAQ
jgi:hypothetical protein